MGKPHPTDQLAWAWLRELDAPPGGDIDRVRGSLRRFQPGGQGLVEGPGDPYVLRPVTSYAGLAPHGRPPAYCPLCLTRVTLKLGRKVRHHYAHQAVSAGCPASEPEGALHLGAKLHLASALAGGGSHLDFQQVCAGWAKRTRACPPGPVLRLDLAWDAVEVERTVGGLRPDLLLLRDGAAVFAIEIHASHEVDREKRSALARLGIPWIEVSARSILPEATPPWNGEEPLVARAQWDGERVWRCGPCAAGHAGEQHFRDNGVHRLAWRPVHLYLTDRGRLGATPELEDSPVTLVAERRDGIAVAVWLTREATGAQLAPRRTVGDGVDPMRVGHELFRGWVREERRRPGAVIDSPLGWQPLGDWERPEVSARRYPSRYGWHRWLQRWARVPGELAPWPLSPHPRGAEQAQAVTGPHPLAWTDLDPGPVTHFAARAWWLSVRSHAGGVHLHALHHDGRRWAERPCPDPGEEADLKPGIRSLLESEPELVDAALLALSA